MRKMFSVNTLFQRRVAIHLGIILLCGACDVVPFTSPQIPPELQFVLDQEELFVTKNDPLARVTPGTLMDDLDTLSGCWGQAVTEKDGEPALIKLYSVSRFDADTGKYSSWGLQRDVFGLIPILSIQTGTFEVVDDSRLLTIVLESRANDPRTGEVAFAAPFEPPLVRSPLATLSDDALSLWYAEEAENITGDAVQFLVYRRFDCP